MYDIHQLHMQTARYDQVGFRHKILLAVTTIRPDDALTAQKTGACSGLILDGSFYESYSKLALFLSESLLFVFR